MDRNRDVLLSLRGGITLFHRILIGPVYCTYTQAYTLKGSRVLSWTQTRAGNEKVSCWSLYGHYVDTHPHKNTQGMTYKGQHMSCDNEISPTSSQKASPPQT